jgi:hypothetical protein
MTEPVFVLPKVFVAGGLALSRYDPQILSSGPAAPQLSGVEYAFMKTFAERLYFALKRYKAETQTGMASFEPGAAIRSNLGSRELSSFEAMLSLIEFNRANPYIHMYQRQMAVSRTPRLVDWKKTFSNQVVLSL